MSYNKLYTHNQDTDVREDYGLKTPKSLYALAFGTAALGYAEAGVFIASTTFVAGKGSELALKYIEESRTTAEEEFKIDTIQSELEQLDPQKGPLTEENYKKLKEMHEELELEY